MLLRIVQVILGAVVAAAFCALLFGLGGTLIGFVLWLVTGMADDLGIAWALGVAGAILGAIGGGFAHVLTKFRDYWTGGQTWEPAVDPEFQDRLGIYRVLVHLPVIGSMFAIFALLDWLGHKDFRNQQRGRWARALLASGFVGAICLVVIVLLYMTAEPEQLAGAQLKPLLLIMLTLTLAAGAAGAVTDSF